MFKFIFLLFITNTIIPVSSFYLPLANDNINFNNFSYTFLLTIRTNAGGTYFTRNILPFTGQRRLNLNRVNSNYKIEEDPLYFFS